MKRNPVRTLLSLVVAGSLVSAVTVAEAAHATAPPAHADVIVEWNTIAARTIFTENATPVPAAPLYFGFVSLAVYDAVVAIEGGYDPYRSRPRAHRKASTEAAAATAAYKILRHYFPASAAALDADYATARAEIPDGAAEVHGVRVGRRTARAMIRSRAHDGRNDAEVADPGGLAPGQWRPTPDAFAPMAVPWLGFVTPLLLDSPTQIAVPPPHPLDSAAYAQDVAEAQAYGVMTGSLRSQEQTDTALFWNTNAVLKYQMAMQQQVARRGLDVVAAARAFAILNAATADTLIACWRVKYDTVRWRPETAIQLADTDGNDATVADVSWVPLVASPPYPEYPSGHACVTGAMSGTLAHLFGADAIDLTVPSLSTAPERHFATTAALDAETNDARIWLGIHVRQAMTVGNQLGHDVAAFAVSHHFRPTC